MAKKLEQFKNAAVIEHFFPNLRDRIKRRMKINPKFTAPGTLHFKTKP